MMCSESGAERRGPRREGEADVDDFKFVLCGMRRNV